MRAWLTLAVLTVQRTVAALTCVNDCNADSGWGECYSQNRLVNLLHDRKGSSAVSACKCAPGHGGQDCSFQMSTIYFSESVYTNLDVQPLDLQGWGSPPEAVALYRKLCEVEFYAQVRKRKTGLPLNVFFVHCRVCSQI